MEVQQENKILIKKMLSIDMKPGVLNRETLEKKTVTPIFTSSLNRVSRLRELTKVNHEN
jgi:hypothetical protein